MNNLHRDLAPISDSAWGQIEAETSRTLKRYLAGRRVVDVKGPAGTGLSAIGTGHLRSIAASAKGILARQREAMTLVELRVPFELDRQMIDDVERGANDSDWQPAKDAARQIALPRTEPSLRVTPPPALREFVKGPATRSRPCRATCVSTRMPSRKA